MSESSASALPPGRPRRQPFIHPESLSLDSSYFSSLPVNFLQELPSYRSIARRRTNIISRDKQSGTLLKPTGSCTSQLEGGITENLDSQSIRKYALNISEKRRLRDIQETQMKYLSEWDQWKRYSSKSWKRFLEKAREMTAHLELWREDLRSIEGKFGTGIQSYFSFLRFLVLLNLVIFLIIFMVVLLPILLTKYKITNSSFVLIPSKDIGESQGPVFHEKYYLAIMLPSLGIFIFFALGYCISQDGLGYAAETNDPETLST